MLKSILNLAKIADTNTKTTTTTREYTAHATDVKNSERELAYKGDRTLRKKHESHKLKRVNKILRATTGWEIRPSKKFPVTKKNLKAFKRLSVEVDKFLRKYPHLFEDEEEED